MQGVSYIEKDLERNNIYKNLHKERYEIEGSDSLGDPTSESERVS